MKKKFVLIAALVAALVVVIASCDDSGTGSVGAPTVKPGENPALTALKAKAGGIKLTPAGTNKPDWDDDTKVLKITAADSRAFTITFKDLSPAVTVEAGDTVTVTYSCYVESPIAQLSAKAGVDKYDVDLSYPTLETGEDKTVDITFAKSGTTISGDQLLGLTFQHNWHNKENRSAVYYLKITKVAKKS